MTFFPSAIKRAVLPFFASAIFLSGAACAQQEAPKFKRTFLPWSPDSQYLTFNADWDGNYDLYIIKLDGTGLRKLTHNDTSDRFPVFDLDGKSILFSKRGESEGDDTDIYRYILSTGKEEKVFGEDNIVESQPQPIANGKIGFVYNARDPDHPGASIGVWDPATGKYDIIVGGPGVNVYTSWADNGKFVFTSNRHDVEAGHFDVYMANWDGSDLERLHLYPDDADGAGSSSAVISKDGKTIVYASDKEGAAKFDFDQWIYDVASKTEVKMPRPPGAKVGPVTISPDGKYIAYAVDYDNDGQHQIAILDLKTLKIVKHIDVDPMATQ